MKYDLVVRDVSLLDGKRVDMAIAGGMSVDVGGVPAGYERVVRGKADYAFALLQIPTYTSISRAPPPRWMTRRLPSQKPST